MPHFHVEFMNRSSFSSPEDPESVVSWSSGLETRGLLQIKPSGFGDENDRPFEQFFALGSPIFDGFYI